jgi:arsenite methyltransferase
MQVLWGECISGALYVEDFKRIARDVGFIDPRVLSAAPIEIKDPDLKDVTGEAKFYSITFRYAPSL